MKKKISPVQIVRAVIQLIAFITVPALFITIFSSIGGLITSIADGSFVLIDNLGSIVLVLAVFLITLVWGRFFCGFICSFGAMQDLLGAVGRLIPFKIKVPEKADKWLKLLKYAVLAFVAAGVWGFSVTGDILWSPWTVFGIYSSLSGWNSLKYFLTLGGALLLLIIIGSLFIERFFCRYLCPLGALFSLVSRFRIYSLDRKPDKCGNCKVCTANCSMGIPLYRYDEVRSGECINCMRCTSACQKENISMDIMRAIAGTVAAASVAGLYYAGMFTASPDPGRSEEKPESVIVTATENAEEATEYTGDIAGYEVPTEVITEIASEIAGQTEGGFADGVYTGTGNGFRGATNVTVTVENGEITDITVNSYSDDEQFFSRAENGVISSVIKSQSTDVDAVSGATFSSNGIKEAVADALGIEFTNPNSTQQKGHGGRHSH